MRNLDVGRWRIYARVQAGNGSVLIKDDRSSEVLLRKASQLTSTAP